MIAVDRTCPSRVSVSVVTSQRSGLLSLGNAPSHSLVDVSEGLPNRGGRVVDVGTEADRRGDRAGRVRDGLIHRRTPPGFRRASGGRSRGRVYQPVAGFSPPTRVAAASPVN